MPIHDWSRVSANLFHDFHQSWTVALRNALNGGLLPPGYSALVEQHAAGLVTDVLALHDQPRAAEPGTAPGGVLTAGEQEALAARANRVAIHHPLGRVVCVIEVVSPGNKASRSALRAFLDKAVELLRHGVHLLLVDLFPPTPRDPQGIHKALWDEFEEQPYDLLPDKPLTLAAYVAGVPKVAYVEPVAAGDVLPDMPAYLTPDGYVPVPLEATYLATWATWATCPPAMRAAVAGSSR